MAEAAAQAARAAMGGDPAGSCRRSGRTAARLLRPAGGSPGRARRPVPELDPFVALVQALRDLIPPDLQRRLVEALRELLLALRALIDWYLERLERRREQPVEVQDIPIL